MDSVGHEPERVTDPTRARSSKVMRSRASKGHWGASGRALLLVAIAGAAACASVACRGKDDGGSAPDAAPSAAASASADPVSAPTIVHVADDASAHEAEHPEGDGGDAGADGGRRLRRLKGDAGAASASATTVLETAPAPPPEPPPAPAAATLAPRRAPPTPMTNDNPYGTASPAGAPSLKKAPLQNEDPWAKPASK